MVYPQIILARDSHMMMRDGVQQFRVAVFIRLSIRDDGSIDTMLEQVETGMQSGDSCADDSDLAFQLVPPSMNCRASYRFT